MNENRKTVRGRSEEQEEKVWEDLKNKETHVRRLEEQGEKVVEEWESQRTMKESVIRLEYHREKVYIGEQNWETTRKVVRRF